MKKIFCLLCFYMLIIVYPSNVFALSATTRLDYRGPSKGVYTIIITLQNASDVTGFTSTVDIPESITVNNDITCGSGSTCSITDGTNIVVSNTSGLTGEICRFTVTTTDSFLDFSLSNSKVSDAGGTIKSIYNPSTAASGSSTNPPTGFISSTLLIVTLFISVISVNIISKKSKFKNI